MFKLFGTKHSQLDIYKDFVTKIRSLETSMNILTNDELREHTRVLGIQIRDHFTNLNSEIESKMNRANQDEGGDIFELLRLNKEVVEMEKLSFANSEVMLETFIPQAFAILVSTCSRFSNLEFVEVSANSNDYLLSSIRQYISIVGNKAFYATKWEAGGSEITWNMTPYESQLLAGVILQHGQIAEMQNGEGKTLAAAFPLFLNAIAKRKVHVCTANSFLAIRDCHWMRPLFEFHGINVADIDSTIPNTEERRFAYNAEIVYGTANEFGFDYLRNNLVTDVEDIVQSNLDFVIIDEIDSVLIDESMMPLNLTGSIEKEKHILGQFQTLKPLAFAMAEEQNSYLERVFELAKSMWEKGDIDNACKNLYIIKRGAPKYKPMHDFIHTVPVVLSSLNKFEKKIERQQGDDKVEEQLFYFFDDFDVEITEKGKSFIIDASGDFNFWEVPDLDQGMTAIENEGLDILEEVNKKRILLECFEFVKETQHILSQLIRAIILYSRDIDYVVLENHVYLVDSVTGRLQKNRVYGDGLQQAIETKEDVEISDLSESYATISLQAFFQKYRKVGGMTATAKIDELEYKAIFDKQILEIAPHRPKRRIDLEDLVYRSKREKLDAIVKEVIKLIELNRPILIGTLTVEDSELISERLTANNITHNVLNAKHHEEEALIIAEAGKCRNVTIAAKMAGRGTDIKLTEESIKSGGLAVLGFERNKTRRLDEQLKGRAGRQGAPGTTQFFVSFEDDLLRMFGSDKIATLMNVMGYQEGETIQHSMISKSIVRAQKKVEELKLARRFRLYEYDNSLNLAREGIYQKRNHALFGNRVKLDVMLMFDEVSNMVITAAEKNYQKFVILVLDTFNSNTAISQIDFEKLEAQSLRDKLYIEVYRNYINTIEGIAQRAFPVISSIRETQGSHIENVAIPFAGKLFGFQVLSKLDKAISTLCKDPLELFQAKVIIYVIDKHWKMFLKRYDIIKEDISLASVIRKRDPLMLFKEGITEYYMELLNDINFEIVNNLCYVRIPMEQKEEITDGEEGIAAKD